MSTKTLRKRIALVAVSAMGFGLLSVASANAVASAVRLDGTPSTMLRTDAAAGISQTLEASGAITDNAAITVTVKRNGTTLSSVPAGIVIDWDATNVDSAVGGNTAADDNDLAVAAAAPLVEDDGLAAISFARTLAPGKYTISVTAGTGTAVAFNTYISTAPTAISFDEDSYAGDVAGAAVTTNVSLTDAQSNPTYLLSGEAVDLTVTGGLTNGTKPTLSSAFLDSASYNNTSSGGVDIDVDPTAATAGTYTLTAKRASGLTGVANATATITLGSAPKTATALAISSGTYVNADGDADATYDETGDLSTVAAGALAFVSTSQTATTFVAATASTSGTIRFTVVAAGSGLPAGITTSTGTDVAIVDNGSTASPRYTASLTLTALAPAAGYGYTVSDGTNSWEVTYQAPIVNKVTTTDSLMDGASITSLKASVTSVEFITKDQFGVAIANQAVTGTSVGRNARNSGLVSGASGTATFSFTDTSTSTLALSDEVTGTISGSRPTGAPAADNTASFTVTYVSSIDVSTVTLSGNIPSKALTANSIAYASAISALGTTSVVLKTNTTALLADVAANVGAKDQAVARVAVKDAAGNPIAGVKVTFTGSTGVFFGSAVTASLTSNASIVPVAGSTAVTTKSAYTDGDGYAFVQARFTKVGSGTVTATSYGVTSTALAVTVTNAAADARSITTTAATGSTGSNTVASFTVTDGFGNVVSGVDVKFAVAGVGTFLNGTNTVTGTTDASGVVTAALTSASAGTATVTGTVTTSSQAADEAVAVTALGFAAAVKAATSTVTLAVTKSAELLAIEAIAAKAAADKAESDAKIAALQAQIAANKVVTDAAIAAAQAAAVAAAEAAADAAAEAIDAGNNAYDAAGQAGEAADAATAAAEQAGEDAVAAAEAAGAAAVAAAEAAQEAAAEATDAANAATDAANASAEAADAATAAAQDAADAVAALSTQVSEMISALKKQITALTNLVIKIQKKVKA